MSRVEPGWYQDPESAAGVLRWWDGARWTETRQIENASAGGGGDGLFWGGVIAGLLLPIVGFVISIILFARNRVGQGIAVLLCCIAGFMLGLALLYG